MIVKSLPRLLTDAKAFDLNRFFRQHLFHLGVHHLKSGADSLFQGLGLLATERGKLFLQFKIQGFLNNSMLLALLLQLFLLLCQVVLYVISVINHLVESRGVV